MLKREVKEVWAATVVVAAALYFFHQWIPGEAPDWSGAVAYGAGVSCVVVLNWIERTYFPHFADSSRVWRAFVTMAGLMALWMAMMFITVARERQMGGFPYRFSQSR